MATFSGATELLFSWLLSPLIWFALVFVFLLVTVGFLYIRKRRKLIYQCLEIVDYEWGKTGFNLIKAGWFGKKKALNRWLDWGDEQVETQDGDIILGFSTEHFQEINGKRGVVCVRDPKNPEILVPVESVEVKNKNLLVEIAPAEYRDAAVRIIDEADRETRDWTQQVVQWVLLAGTIVLALVSIIVITQMVKQGQQKAADLIVQAGETCLRNAQEVCRNIAVNIGGTSP